MLSMEAFSFSIFLSQAYLGSRGLRRLRPAPWLANLLLGYCKAEMR